jgi:hypothetical protein
MSKTKTKTRKQLEEERFEQILDQEVRTFLATPGVLSKLLGNKSFVKETLLETRKVKKDPVEIKGLGDKYNLPSEDINQGLAEVEEMMVKMLGEED